ncbi:hypothetical protein LOAG_00813 [Loa loa]|uniref:Uncharacterized protein n=1 Tax=Loa loa TaxID=7209 RepID=A0A1S0UCG4_LOALO|nr:hypothetical protein LOAG_00813 [Loa loa]EFO27660.1 hypothetical protein LOAG_00813 [Loa loa]
MVIVCPKYYFAIPVRQSAQCRRSQTDHSIRGDCDQTTGIGKRDGDNVCVCDDPIDYGNATIGWLAECYKLSLPSSPPARPVILLPHLNPQTSISFFRIDFSSNRNTSNMSKPLY